MSRGDGTFLTRRDLATSGAQRSLAFEDFNKDGKLDIVSLANDSSDVSVLLNSSQ